MEKVYLESVFCDSGIPKFTFVEPKEYTKTKIALRSKGRGVVIEGPSGIGKTTCIRMILDENNINPIFLSARMKADRELIDLFIQDPRNNGVVIIDDFHLLDADRRKDISDILKFFADEAVEDTKLILIGINRAGECLVKLAPDLNNRIDTIKFERNPDDKVLELIEKGEQFLNIQISDKHKIAKKSFGSFHIAQMLCKTLCIRRGITETQDKLVIADVQCQDIIDEQMNDLSRVFGDVLRAFSVGNRNRRTGILPYFQLLKWLSASDEGALSMHEMYMLYPMYKHSVSQIADKGYLQQLIQKNEELSKVFHYESSSKILAIEDPKFIFYIRNTNWDKFARDMGFRVEKDVKYDFALSFAGEKRKYAEMIHRMLVDNECMTFYDKDASADILGLADIKSYFGPIYASEAKFVVVLLDSNYPRKVWTVFESDKFKERLGKNVVIPVLFNDFAPSPMDPLYNMGYERIDEDKDMESEVRRVVNVLFAKLDNQ